MRIDRGKVVGAFDNMQNRPITGSQDWTQHTVVLDVASDATGVSFGIQLVGKGAVWIDDLAFDVVGADVPVTDQRLRFTAPGPRNLNFENGLEKR
jgi:hypothetical protein